MLGAVPAFLAYPNFKIEPSKYRSGLEGVTANLRAKAVVIDHEFPEEFLAYVSLHDDAKLIRAVADAGVPTIEEHPLPQENPDGLAFIQHSAGTTGLQKAVALTHEAVLTQLTHLAEALQIDSSSDRHLQLASSLPRYGTDCLLHAADGVSCSGSHAVTAGLGDASGSHAADCHRASVHTGVDAELRVSIRATADPTESVVEV